MPRDHGATVRALARDIEHRHRRLRPRPGALCLLLGTMYAIGLTLTGLNFAILIGLFAGYLTSFPMSAR